MDDYDDNDFIYDKYYDKDDDDDDNDNDDDDDDDNDNYDDDDDDDNDDGDDNDNYNDDDDDEMSTCPGSADHHFLDWPGWRGCIDSLQGAGPEGDPPATHPLIYWSHNPLISSPLIH